ncbi:MAG: thiamine pyrophosphate-dependent dehydrogenase E1 component subunit alpha [Anaerolineae bacterium]|jgi:pyruvate dehydrogenase E1 component alpha subunit
MTDQINRSPVDIEGLDHDLALDMFRRMCEAREFEEQLYYLFLTTDMPGTMHQATGQEAVAVGVASALEANDYVTSTHRGHAHCVARGVPIDGMMAEMFATRQGICKGMGGSMHLADYSRGMLGAFGIVGAGIPIATGAAFSARIRQSGQVAVAFFGDGAVNEGVFHESLNLASLWTLPAVYVIENNQFALSMRVKESSALTDLAGRACAYDMPGVSVDGNDVTAVYRAARDAVERARRGEGPTLIEARTYRIRGHARFEPAEYRDEEEVEAWREADPIERLAEALLRSRIATREQLDRFRQQAATRVEQAIAYAEQCEAVGPRDYLQYITEETTGEAHGCAH